MFFNVKLAMPAAHPCASFEDAVSFSTNLIEPNIIANPTQLMQITSLMIVNDRGQSTYETSV